jgi:hypothetical protein
VELVERKGGRVETIRKIRLWDKMAALNLLAKYHRLLTDRAEVDLNATRDILTPEQAARMSDQDLAEAARKVAVRATALADSLAPCERP